MIRCTALFGIHKWEKWELTWGGIDKRQANDTPMRQRVQRRQCAVCDYQQTEWLNEWAPAKDAEEKDDTGDKK